MHNKGGMVRMRVCPSYKARGVNQHVAFQEVLGLVRLDFRTLIIQVQVPLGHTTPNTL
jgi:hypothetical protein